MAMALPGHGHAMSQEPNRMPRINRKGHELPESNINNNSKVLINQFKLTINKTNDKNAKNKLHTRGARGSLKFPVVVP